MIVDIEIVNLISQVTIVSLSVPMANIISLLIIMRIMPKRPKKHMILLTRILKNRKILFQNKY